MEKDTYDIFKLLSHPVRLRICELLKPGPMTHEEMAKGLRMTKLQLSTHINQMRNLGILWSSEQKRPQYHDIDKRRLDVALDDFAKCAKLGVRRRPGKLERESNVGWFTHTSYMPKNMWKKPSPPARGKGDFNPTFEIIVEEIKPRKRKKKKKKSRAKSRKRKS